MTREITVAIDEATQEITQQLTTVTAVVEVPASPTAQIEVSTVIETTDQLLYPQAGDWAFDGIQYSDASATSTISSAFV